MGDRNREAEQDDPQAEPQPVEQLFGPPVEPPADAGAEDKPLAEMTRDELEAAAAEAGVDDPGSYANKDDLARAIEAARAPGGQGESIPRSLTGTPEPTSDTEE